MEKGNFFIIMQMVTTSTMEMQIHYISFILREMLPRGAWYLIKLVCHDALDYYIVSSRETPTLISFLQCPVQSR